MITPNNMTIQNFANYLNTHEQFVRISYILRGSTTGVFTNEDVSAEGIQIKSYVNSSNTYTFGHSFSKQVIIHLFDSSKATNINFNGEFTLEFGIEEIPGSGNIEWSLFGYFKGDDVSYNYVSKTYTIIAYDRMKLFDVDVQPFIDTIPWSHLTFDMNIKWFTTQLCKYVGLECMTLPSMQGYIAVQMLSMLREIKTCRDMLDKILEASGLYARISQDGKVEVFAICSGIWEIQPNPLYPIPIVESDCFELNYSNRRKASIYTTYGMLENKNIKWGDLVYTKYVDLYNTDGGYYYTGLRLTFKDYPTAEWINEDVTTDIIYIIENNPFWINRTGTPVKMFYEDIEVRQYLTFYNQLSTLDKYALCEAGDVLEFINHPGTGGIVYMPVFSCEINWNGSFVCAFSSPTKLEFENIKE